MGKRLWIALLVTIAAATASLAQPRPPVGPDLAIPGISASQPKVGVGETFFYTFTARNGGVAPCNWLNLTLQLPGEVDLVSASSSAPLTCGTEFPIRIVGQPFDVICRGGPGYFLFPGDTVTTTVFVRALRSGNNVKATAVADPGNVCFETNEANKASTPSSSAGRSSTPR